MSHDVRTAERVRVRVVRSLCVGSGLCTELAPRVFTFSEDGKARAGAVSDAELDRARNAASACPARAILILRAERHGGHAAR